MIEIPENEYEFSFARSGGKGGQNVNKVETKVTLRWNLWRSRVLDQQQRERLMHSPHLARFIDNEGTIVLTSQMHRTQERNRAETTDRLHKLVALALKPRKRRVKTKASRASKERRIQSKKRNAEKKRDRSGTW